jgi:hypothetical protein
MFGQPIIKRSRRPILLPLLLHTPSPDSSTPKMTSNGKSGSSGYTYSGSGTNDQVSPHLASQV